MSNGERDWVSGGMSYEWWGKRVNGEMYELLMVSEWMGECISGLGMMGNEGMYKLWMMLREWVNEGMY